MNKMFSSIVLLSLIALTADIAGASASKDIALVLKVTGQASVQLKNKKWINLQRGQRLNDGDRIQTGANTLVVLVFTDDKTMMKIRSESDVTIGGERQKKGIAKRIFMSLGEMWTKVTPGVNEFRIETPSGVAAVKGTEFYSMVDTFGSLKIIGLEGIVEILNEMGSILVKKGETGIAKKSSKPVVAPTDSIDDWANQDVNEGEIQFEFKNPDGSKKQLKIQYQKK